MPQQRPSTAKIKKKKKNLHSGDHNIGTSLQAYITTLFSMISYKHFKWLHNISSSALLT